MNNHQQLLQQQLLLQQQQQQQQQQAVQLQQQVAQARIVDGVLKHLQRGQDSSRSLSQRRESFQEIQSVILHIDNRFFIQAAYTQLAGHIQPLLQDPSEEIANTAAMLLGALGSVLDITVQGWYNYILDEMMKRQSHPEHLKDFRHLVLSLAECIQRGDSNVATTYHAQYMPHVAMQLSRNFSGLQLPDFVISATYPMFAIARKYPLLFYQSCANALLSRLYDLLLTPSLWSSKPQIAERISTYFDIQSQAMGNFPNESFSMISLMVSVLNKSIAFYTRTTERHSVKKGGSRPHCIGLEASLRSFYRSMSEFHRIDSDGNALNNSNNNSTIENGPFNDASDEIQAVQFLKGSFVNVVLHNLECIKCCIVTLPDIGRTELQLFQTLFQSLSAIPSSMHCPRLIRKIYSVIREFAERFLNYPTVFKFASLLLDSPEMESKDSVWFNPDILMINNWIRLIFEHHLSSDILFRLHSEECTIQCIDCLVIFINHFGSYWPGIIHDLLHLKNLYDLILRCTPSVTMHFAEVLGVKLIQNKQITIGITAISVISLHVHYLLTDTASPSVRSLTVNKQYPILQDTIAKLSMTDRHILLSFFVQCFAYFEPFKCSSSSSPISMSNEETPNEITSPPQNILCSNILQCLCFVLYRTEIRGRIASSSSSSFSSPSSSLSPSLSLSSSKRKRKQKKDKEGTRSDRMVWTEEEITTFEASLTMSAFVEFHNFQTLPLLRTHGDLMELVVSVLYKLRRSPTWKETEMETEHDVLCQLSIALSLLSLSWLPHSALSVLKRKHNHYDDSKGDQSQSSLNLKFGPTMIELLLRWVDSIVALKQHSIEMATYDRMATIFADLALFPDAEIRAQIGFWMNSILSHLVAHHEVQCDSSLLDLWTVTALSRITDRDERVRKNYMKVLELCGTQLKRPGFELNFHPGQPQWVTPFLHQMLSLPLPDSSTLTPKRLQCLLNYLGSAKEADDDYIGDPSSRCGIALWSSNWAGHPPQQHRDGYQVLRKFFEENTIYVYKKNAGPFYQHFVSNLESRRLRVDRYRKKSRRTGRRYMDLPRHLLALHSEHDWFISHYWICTVIAKYLVLHKLNTKMGNPLRSLSHLKTLIEGEQSDLAMASVYTECLDMIEKFIFNAYEGCINLPCCPDDAALKFFVGNRKVCQVYFRRELRPPLVKTLYRYGISSMSLIHQSSRSTTYSWTRFLRYLQAAKYQMLSVDTTLIHDVHDNLFMLSSALLSVGDAPGLIGVAQYFRDQVDSAEQCRLQKDNGIDIEIGTPGSPPEDDDGNNDRETKEIKSPFAAANEDDVRNLHSVWFHFNLKWLDAMIENAKGSVEDAIPLYAEFVESAMQQIMAQNNKKKMKEHKEGRGKQESAEDDGGKVNKEANGHQDTGSERDCNSNAESDEKEDTSNGDKGREREDDADHDTKEGTVLSELLVNGVTQLALQCCLDAGDWIRYKKLLHLIERALGHEESRLNNIRGYSTDYTKALSDFDSDQMRSACDNLASWQLNADHGAARTRLDLSRSADIYHLRSMLLNYSGNTKIGGAGIGQKKDKPMDQIFSAKTAAQHCRATFEDPLRVVAHGNFRDQYALLLRSACCRAVEIADLNVLNPFVRAVRFDEMDILDATCCGDNRQYLVMAHLKPSDLTLAKRTIVGLYRLNEARFDALKQRGDPQIEKRYQESMNIHNDFMYSFARWNLIAGNFKIADQALEALRPATTPAHLFLSTLAMHGKAKLLKVADEAQGWIECIRRTEKKWMASRHLDAPKYLSFSYMQICQLLREQKGKDQQSVTEAAKLVDSSFTNSGELMAKYWMDTGSKDAIQEHDSVRKAELSCHIHSVDAWPTGKANWLSLSKFCMKMVEGLSVPNALDRDRVRLGKMFENEGKTRRIYQKMIGAMNESTMKLNHHTLSQDFEPASFANLRSSLGEGAVTQSQLMAIHEMMLERRKRMVQYLKLSASAHHRILSRYGDERSESTGFERDDNVALCLNLFTMICNFGMDLMEVVVGVLDETPFDAWVQLIPQLFSRLGHSQPAIRQQIEGLVMGITRCYPSAVIFPVVSGLSSIDPVHSTEDSGLSYSVKSSNLQMALQRTLGKLRESDQFSLVLSQVSDMKRELARISVLWEDKWLQIIQEINHMMPSRIRLLEHEINLIVSTHTTSSSPSKRSSMQSSPIQAQPNGIQRQQSEIMEAELLLERYQLIMAPILELLTSLESTITSIPNTPHEYKFERKYAKRIKALLNKFRSPSPSSVKTPSVLWRNELSVLLEELSSLFSVYRSWSLHEISPLLHRMKSTVISIPGMERIGNTHRKEHELDGKVSLQSIYNRVEIIRSKTRPKKLSFVGDDGRSYQYLLKSREDLNLDERIMQFLRNCNGMVSRHAYTYKSRNVKSGDAKCGWNTLYNQRLRTRWYEVIPLDKRTGLIRFVDHATPLYLIFRAWQDNYGKSVTQSTIQQKDAVGKGNSGGSGGAGGSGGGASNTRVAVAKRRGTGIDSFRSLINEQLRTIDSSFSVQTLARHKWPQWVLKKVFTEMCQRSPKELIWRELWCSSASVNDYMLKCTTFSQSAALSSVLGWLIGLGDRHIGNILLDFRTGELVHIDFNVCFEKGYRLRVPELVPFRLTRSMQYALGISGTTQTRGHFYSTAQYILHLLRSNGRNWIQLFSAFIYDPISEWLTKQSANYLQRQIMDLTMGLQLIYSRLGGDTNSSAVASKLADRRRAKKKGRKKNKSNDEEHGDFRSLLDKVQAFSVKLMNHLPPMMDDNDSLQKEMQSCLSSFVDGHGQLVDDCFAPDNFVSKFAAAQPTTQKAKHFYESYLHLHNITSKIPPRYSALLQEQAIEWDKKWRRYIRISYEMVHQSLCLVAFYQKVICALFDARHYHKTSVLYSYLNEASHREVLGSLPWGDRPDALRKELSWYQGRLTMLERVETMPVEYPVVTPDSVRDWFLREGGDLKMCSAKGKVYLVLHQIHTVQLRLVFLRKSMEPERMGDPGKVSVARHLLGKLQVAGLLVRQLASYEDVLPNIISPETAASWTRSMEQSMLFLDTVVSLTDTVVDIIGRDTDSEDNRFEIVSMESLSSAPSEYMESIKEAVADIGEIGNKYDVFVSSEDVFTSWKKNRAPNDSSNHGTFVYKKKALEAESKHTQLESTWESIRTVLQKVCAFDSIVPLEKEEKGCVDEENVDTEFEVEANSEYEDGVEDVDGDSEQSESRGDYPLMSLFKMLLQILEQFDVVIRGYRFLALFCRDSVSSNVTKDSISKLMVEGESIVMMKGIDIIVAVLRMLKIDLNRDGIRLLSSSMTKSMVMKVVWERMGRWMDHSADSKNRTGFIQMSCNVLEHVLGNMVSEACIWSGDPSLSDSERLNRMRKSLTKMEQRAVSDLSRRMMSWMDHLEEEHGRNAVCTQYRSATEQCRQIVDFLKRCAFAARWLGISDEDPSAESGNGSAAKHVHPALFSMLAEGEWSMADLYDLKHFDGRSLLPFLSYLNSEFSKIYRELKSEHRDYLALEEELVSTMQQWSSDRYPVVKGGQTLMEAVPSETENKEDDVASPPSADDAAVSTPDNKRSNKMIESEGSLYEQQNESLEEVAMESDGDDVNGDDDEEEVDEDVEDDNNDDVADNGGTRKMKSPKRTKSPFAQKRKKEAKIKEMEDFIRKAMEQIEARRAAHASMISNYNHFGSVLNRIYGLEVNRKGSELLPLFHLQSARRISTKMKDLQPAKQQFWVKVGQEFESLLSALHEKYGHIHPMVEMVLRYISSDSGLYVICERLQSDYKQIQQDLQALKSFLVAKGQSPSSLKEDTTWAVLQQRAYDMLVCNQEAYNVLAGSEALFEENVLFCRKRESMMNLLTYRIMNLKVDLDDLQIVIASVLKHDLISALSPFQQLSQREANSMGDEVVDGNPSNDTNVDESGAKPEDVRRDRDRVLLSYFVKMNFRNIGNPESEEEDRSKHGYEVVQYMGYKLHGTAHNITKSAHHNTVEMFDQLKEEATVGSNHCDEQYRQEMGTALLTGCYNLFKEQNNANRANNAMEAVKEEKNEWEDHMSSGDVAENKETENVKVDTHSGMVSGMGSEQNQDDDDEKMVWKERNEMEQLDTMIDEATDSNRLCRMYEGWAPWM